ncbi:DUF4129 domain-containing protein [Pseudoxanthomonas winnipegensis]|uniref:DUF4129 domain-containing protein n=1 Tax=Pseudoxanthomonas winnipegensis TaxID=2480810 RepID=UPI00103EC59E|nr:DUF4129 domain-containing protein [Pseudoxanthomonas winnipegensis]TBV75437.1 DUF4129 domain-containing protein [Pseudoxanthomonas winnipegensis]
MRAEQLTVELRARSPWEAVELGTALVRRHAGAIWKPWLWLALPVFALVNAGAWALSSPLASCLVLWWIKPLFDRVPLYVISRGVFGQVPTTRQTLAAQLRWGWRPMLGYLTWRRFSGARSLFLPIETLEGEHGARLRARRRVLGATLYGNALVLTLVFLGFQLALTLACVAMVAVFVPIDYLPQAARAGLAMLSDPPLWAQLGFNAFFWIAIGAVEPFFVGAGFGLYLNRRTQIEAWDVEIAFRRLRQRLLAAAAPLVLLLALVGVAPLRAQQPAPASEAPPPPGVEQVFEGQRVDDARFRRAVVQAYRDPLIDRHRTDHTWQRRRPPEIAEPPKLDMSWLESLQRVLAFIGEWGLWIVLGLLLVFLLASARHWWPWMRGVRTPRPVPAPVTTGVVELPQVLPPDIAASARRLWAQGQPRHALALLYRASVEAMAERAGVVLPPGATEAQCLRAAQRQPEEADRGLFARMVRVWQYAAYAQRLPQVEEFEALIAALQTRYRWPA